MQVDTHIHASACMNQKHLLRFMKKTMKKNASDVVLTKDGKDYTLQEVRKLVRIVKDHCGRVLKVAFGDFNVARILSCPLSEVTFLEPCFVC